MNTALNIILYLIVSILIRAQDATYFADRQAATATLEKIAYVYDERPQLNAAITADNLEIRWRSQTVKLHSERVYLWYLSQFEIPALGETVGYIGAYGVKYDSYEDAKNSMIYKIYPAATGEIESFTKPMTTKDFLKYEKVNDVSEVKILETLETKWPNAEAFKWYKLIFD